MKKTGSSNIEHHDPGKVNGVLSPSGREADVEPSSTRVPRHVAIIMDGNGRWARRQGLPRIEGHRAGVKTVRMVVEEARRCGIRYLTLYAFSQENWQRPPDEVSALMGLFQRFLKSELKKLLDNGIRLRVVGDRERLPQGVRQSLQEDEKATASMTGMDLILAVSYGARNEIVQAARALASKVATQELTLDEITEASFAGALYAPDVPDPDLLIRTSDEFRISNFLLWQLAYSEIIVSPFYWPDFSKEEFERCLREYSKRNRRFGLTDEQITQGVARGHYA